MFKNPRYTTKGINENLPIMTQIILWELIDSINRDSLERFVLNLLSEVIFDKERIPAVIEQYNTLVRENSDSGKEEQKALKRRIKEVERKISNLVAVIEESGSMALVFSRLSPGTLPTP